jgi:hypothetical protein
VNGKEVNGKEVNGKELNLNGQEQPQIGLGRTGSGRPRTIPTWLQDISDVDFAGMAADGSLNKLTANQLKSFLYEQEITYTGTKPMLAKRIADYIASA